MIEALPPTARKSTQDPYPYQEIWINGRHVSIQKIVDGNAPSKSNFEASTFQFIKEWMEGQETFTMRTSGSTGEPKEISISRHQMIRSAQLTAEAIKLQKNSTALLCIDPMYIGGKMMLVRSLVLGLRILAVEPSSNPLIKVPIDKCVQFTAFVPYQVQSILESKHPHLLNSPDKILIGGAPISAKLQEKLDHFQCECYETYGMTETVSHIAIRLVNTAMKQPYFSTLPGVNISQDDRGCLVINADYLVEPVITNDMVEIIEPGKFTWLGRWDSVINTGGVKVMPEKVERTLEGIFLSNNFSHRFFIAALPDEKLGNKVALIIEGVQFSSEVLKHSLAALRAALSPYEIPKEVYSVPEFVNTPTQKIDRSKTLAAVTLLSPVD